MPNLLYTECGESGCLPKDKIDGLVKCVKEEGNFGGTLKTRHAHCEIYYGDSVLVEVLTMNCPPCLVFPLEEGIDSREDIDFSPDSKGNETLPPTSLTSVRLIAPDRRRLKELAEDLGVPYCEDNVKDDE